MSINRSLDLTNLDSAMRERIRYLQNKRARKQGVKHNGVTVYPLGIADGAQFEVKRRNAPTTIGTIPWHEVQTKWRELEE